MRRPLFLLALALPLHAGGAAAQIDYRSGYEPARSASGSVLARRLGADLSAGTTGLGANVQFGLHERLALRGGAHWLDVSGDVEEGDIDYDGDAKLSGVAAFADLHPFANGFTVTGGVFLGEKVVDLVAEPDQPVSIGGETFTPDQIGTLTGGADFADAAFFAGLGYDDVLYGDGRLSIVARAGVMFVGEPDVTLDASRAAQDPTGELRAALDAEIADLEDDIGDYAYYPVVTIGLGYGF